MNIALPSNSDPIARAMAELPTGYYWIRLEGNSTLWEVAQLRDLQFWACGCDTPMQPRNVAEIGDKLRPFKPNPKAPDLNGDYWVRVTREGPWRIASWLGGQYRRWNVIDETDSRPPEEISVVGPRIEKPNHEWRDY